MLKPCAVCLAALAFAATPASADDKTPVAGSPTATTASVDPALVLARQELYRRLLCLKYGC